MAIQGMAEVQKRLGDLRKALANDSDLTAMALKGAEIIEQRTRRGRGPDGRPFKKYSPGYAEAKRKKSGRYYGRPNLVASGEMLSSLTGYGRRGQAVISFTRQREADKAEFNNRIRPFFRLAPRELSELTAIYRERLRKRAGLRRG